MDNKENILIAIVFCVFCVGCEIIDPIESYYTYRTDYGTIVKLENINNGPKQAMIEAWTKEALDFWGNIFDNSVIDCMMNEELPVIQATFVENDHVICPNAIDKCSGFAFPYKREFTVSNGTQYKVYISFIHELSHVLLNCVRDPHKFIIDHDLFFVIGLERNFKRKYIDDHITLGTNETNGTNHLETWRNEQCDFKQ